jgi:cellulose synthase/poly-beta-1,6-N-acetylglucosamine synthase-like glycosyltransferase
VLLSAASGAARLRFPVTAVGNNFSLRRTAYERVGGYEGIPFSVTEDFSLFHAVTSSGLKAVIPLDTNTTIESKACPTWKSLYEQRKRWFVGGRGMDLTRIVAFAFSFLLSLFVLLGLFFVPWPTWLISVGIKLTSDYLLAYPALKQLGKRSLTRHWLPFGIYFAAYVSLLPFIVLLRPGIVWKERTFNTAPQTATNEKALS